MSQFHVKFINIRELFLDIILDLVAARKFCSNTVISSSVLFIIVMFVLSNIPFNSYYSSLFTYLVILFILDQFIISMNISH